MLKEHTHPAIGPTVTEYPNMKSILKKVIDNCNKSTVREYAISHGDSNLLINHELYIVRLKVEHDNDRVLLLTFEAKHRKLPPVNVKLDNMVAYLHTVTTILSNVRRVEGHTGFFGIHYVLTNGLALTTEVLFDKLSAYSLDTGLKLHGTNRHKTLVHDMFKFDIILYNNSDMDEQPYMVVRNVYKLNPIREYEIQPFCEIAYTTTQLIVVLAEVSRVVNDGPDGVMSKLVENIVNAIKESA